MVDHLGVDGAVRVGGGLVLGVDGLALVLDVGDVAVVVVGGVGDGLEAAVGEVHLRRTNQILLFSRSVFHICAQTPKSNNLPLLFG